MVRQMFCKWNGLVLTLALCFSALSSVEGRGRGRKKRWKSMLPSKKDMLPREPAEVKFEHATELNTSSYVESVEGVASLEKPPYFPFVMYHVSWCKHCKQTLPEFEKAAEMISKAAQDGKLAGLASKLKFFVFQCDQTDESRVYCEKHPGGLPALRLFRDNRTLQFPPRGNRYAKNIAEWSANASRPAVLQVNTTDNLEKLKGLGPVFLLKAHAAAQPAIFDLWVELAFEFIHDAVFAIVPITSEVNQLIPPTQNIAVQGVGIDGLPFEGQLNQQSIRPWVHFNQWQVPVFLTPDITIKLLKTKQQVVVYAFRSGHRYRRNSNRDAEIAAFERYRAKAPELRKDSRYVVACIDLSSRENADFLARVFPVVGVPSVFVFAGESQSEFFYWEDPALIDPSNITLPTLADLTANSWAKHDTSKPAWIKGWAKRAYRFGTGSILGVFCAIVAPCVILAFCGLCIREAWAEDELEIPKELKAKRPEQRSPNTDASKRDKKD